LWAQWLEPNQVLSDGRSVNPLLGTTWNQSCFYNELCPSDPNAPYGYCGHVPVGCVALAMAQVMKYWDYPVSGTGSHSYYASPYGWQSADFGNTTYEWDNMPGSLNNDNLSVATLIYHCAVSVNMQFGPNGSGAFTGDARNSLVNYFDYDAEAAFIYKSSYSDPVWESMLRDELDMGRPVIYRGQGTGGHAWVCDGYAADNYFHMNWGWGGYANGYFYLSALNPAGNNFNSNQAAIMGIVPSDAVLEPPTGLEAQVNGNDVFLSWSAPVEPQWIHWDNGANNGTLSLAGGGSYTVASRWDTNDLEPFDELFITKVSVFLGSDDPEYVLKIWKGINGANLIYTQSLETINEQSWNTVQLISPVQIDASEELYFGLAIIDQPDGAPGVGKDSGPAVLSKGGLISFNGTSWMDLPDLGFNANWNLHAYVDVSPDGKTSTLGEQIENNPVISLNTTLEQHPPEPGASLQSPVSSALTGYNVYRDEVKINDNLVLENSYTDYDLTGGNYNYHVTAVYNAGESAPGNIVSVTVGEVLHNLQLTAGWNSISSYLIPSDPDVQNICNPVMDDMVILKDMANYYYPALNINTLENWETTSGYLIKVDQSCLLPLQGFPGNIKTLTLSNGWNLIPVLSECDVNTEELFGDITSYIRIVKDAAGTGVYWPDKGINTLPVLEPGKSYYVKIFSNKSITFPSCK
jgi:hypothetical protein